MIPAGAIPFGALPVGAQFQTLDPHQSIVWTKTARTEASDGGTRCMPHTSAWLLVQPVAAAPAPDAPVWVLLDDVLELIRRGDVWEVPAAYLQDATDGEACLREQIASALTMLTTPDQRNRVHRLVGQAVRCVTGPAALPSAPDSTPAPDPATIAP